MNIFHISQPQPYTFLLFVVLLFSVETHLVNQLLVGSMQMSITTNYIKPDDMGRESEIERRKATQKIKQKLFDNRPLL